MQNSVVTDEAGRPYAVATDVTEQREREALVHRKATTDALTGRADAAIRGPDRLDGGRGPQRPDLHRAG